MAAAGPGPWVAWVRLRRAADGARRHCGGIDVAGVVALDRRPSLGPSDHISVSRQCSEAQWVLKECSDVKLGEPELAVGQGQGQGQPAAGIAG